MMLIIYSTKDKEVKEFNVDEKLLINLGLTTYLMTPEVSYASSITESLQPIINVLQDLAEPISYGFMIKGFLQIMAGDDHAGQKTIKSAIGGFLGIQFIPKIFSIIRGIKI